MIEVTLRHRTGDLDLDLAFDAPTGVTAIFGPSGAGKTTIVNAVAGLLRPDHGRIVINGRVLLDTAAATDVPPHRRRIGYVFQDARLFPHLSVRQNLLFGRWFRRADPAPLPRILDLLALSPLLDRRPRDLSGGEKQRVAIGRALLSAPDLLIMDEPLASLDSARKQEILPYLERLRDDSGLPILYVSHAMEEVARLATSLVLLREGRITRAGPVADVMPDATLGTDTGGVMAARVTEIGADGLMTARTGAGNLSLPAQNHQIGDMIRIRIRASDVILSLTRPEGLSALNLLPVTIEDLIPEAGVVTVTLRSGDQRLAARITPRSATALGLRAGMECHAIIKTVALATG